MLKVTTRIIKPEDDEYGWSYIILTRKQVDQLKPPNRKSFRVKGFLDKHPIKFTSLLPMGDGRFILPINAGMRKGTGKKAGNTLRLQLALDKTKKKLSPEFIACLKDDPGAYAFFKTLRPSNQFYFSDWVKNAKAEETRANRITLALKALGEGKNFREMNIWLHARNK